MVGEHIRVRKGGRWHHAIDCGDETVLHLVDEPGDAPVRVRRSYRPEFVAGAEAVEVVTHRERTFPPNEVIARAFSRIADPVLASMFRDSEAFAKWCATGRIPPGPEAAPTAVKAKGAAPGGARAAATPPRSTPARPRKARAAPRAKTRPARRARPAAGKKAKKKAAERAQRRKPKAAPAKKGGSKARASGTRRRAPRRKR